jgi:sucrose-6-phosphate hydrolase SacC (GH32 family)
MGGLGAHDVNALFSYGGLAHVMNQRQIEQSAEGKAGFSHLVSRDWVRWQRLPNALAAGSYDGSATVVPGSGPVIMFDCATKICPSGSNIPSSSVGATSVDSGTADVQQHPDDIPVMGVARPANLSDPTLREWVTAAANPIVIDVPGEYVGPSKLWHNSSGAAFMTMNAHNSVIGLFSSVDPQLHHWHLEDPEWFATGGGGAVVFLPLPATVSGDHLVGANGTNHVCGSCDPSLCFILGHFDPDTDQSFTQTIPGKHCTDLGYDMGGFFVYSESGVVPPEAFGHPTASPDWGKAKTRFVQQGWIADLAALTVVRELRFDPVQQSLVSLPVAELASLRGALLTNFSGKTLAAGQPVLTVANGSVATVADIEIDIEMPKGAAAFKVDIGALGAHIQLACSPASVSHPVAGCTLFAPGRGRGKTTRQSYNLGPGETATSLRVLVDKVVLEVFAGGGRSTATVATNKGGVDPSTAVISVGLSVGQATLAGRVWSMGCGWVADVQQQEIALKTDDTDEQAKIVLVSPTGVKSTAPDGTMLVSSVHEARDAARLLVARHGPGRGVIVQLLPGQHHIGGSTLELGPVDSGVVWRGSLDPAAAAVVTAAVAVHGWKADAARPGVLTALIPAAVPAGKALRHLWVGGVRAFKPRYYPPAMAIVVVENSSMPHGSLLPNGGYLFNASAMDPSTFRNPRNVEFVYTGRTGARVAPPAGYAHDHERGAQSGEDPWTEMRCTVDTVRGRSVSLKRACWEALPFAGAEDTHARSVRHQPPAYLENVEANFTEPGEWYLDSEAGSILYRPRVGETLADVEKSAMTAVNSTLLVLKGARDVVYEGVQFEYAVWDPLTTDQQGFVDIQSAQIFNGSVIAASTLQLSGVWNVSFISCNFRHLGGVYVLTAEGGSQGVKIENCTFADCSGGGVKFGSVANCSEGCANGGPSPEGSNPGANSGKGNQWWPKLDTPSEEQDAGLVVTNSWFDSIPTEFHGANAVFVGYAKDVEISHNTIRNTSYSAICIGGGWPKKPSYGKNVQVTYNRITNAMQLLADGGFIYSTSDGVNSTLAYNHMDGDPVQYGGLYHDGGSANWHDTQNVIENVKSSCIFTHGSCTNISERQSWCNNTGRANIQGQAHGLSCRIEILNETNWATWPPEAQAIIAGAGRKVCWPNCPAPTPARSPPCPAPLPMPPGPPPAPRPHFGAAACRASKLSQRWLLSSNVRPGRSQTTNIKSATAQGGCIEITGCSGSSVGTSYGCKPLPKPGSTDKCALNGAFSINANGTVTSIMDGQCLQVSISGDIILAACSAGAATQHFSVMVARNGTEVTIRSGALCVDNDVQQQQGAFKTDDIGEQDDTGGTEPLAVPAIVVDVVDSGDSSAQELNSTALAAENQQLRSEVRLLRQLLAAGAGAGSRRALAPTQAQADVAAKPQRRTLQDLLPPRNSPFRKYLFLNESIFDGAPRHARTTFNPPTNLGAVIKPDQVWEAGIYPFAQVVQFGNEIRVYYHCQGDTPLGTFLVPMLCLAISTDGRSFVKPDLGAVPFNGSKHNNIVMCPVMNGESCDVGAQPSGWYPPGPVWLDPRSGVPPDELWKSTGGNGNLMVSADGIHFRTTSRQVMQRSDWNTWAMIFDEDALPSDGSNCETPGKGTPGRFVAYGRSDDPGNAQLPGHPKVCGDLAGMRAVIRQQSIDGNHTECTNSKLVFPAWDDTDPQPLLNGAPLAWSDTKDASCAGASEAQRIASSQDGRSPWNDVYYTFPVKYGADYLFYIPILRHFQ